MTSNMLPKVREHVQEVAQQTDNQKTDNQTSVDSLAHTPHVFRHILENVTDIVTVLSSDGRVKYDNPRITAFFGYSQEERIGTNAFEYVHPKDVVRVQTVFRELLKKPESIRSVS